MHENTPSNWRNGNARQENHPHHLAPSSDMPREISAAIIAVKRAISTLGSLVKDGTNQYSGYDYTTVDGFFRDIGPLCADAEIEFIPVETRQKMEIINFDRGGQSVCIWYWFKFRIMHESGKLWSDPEDERSILMEWRGPQTSGMAQSYAVKAYMRSLLKVPTGEPDADGNEQRKAQDVGAIAETAKATRAKGKPASRTVAFKWPGGDVAAFEPTADLLEKVKNEIGSREKSYRTKWLGENAAAMTELSTLNKNLWLDVKAIAETA